MGNSNHLHTKGQLLSTNHNIESGSVYILRDSFDNGLCNSWYGRVYKDNSKLCDLLTVQYISRDMWTALSLASSIYWDDREVVHMTRTEVVRSEGVVCLSDINTVSTEDGCWVVLICHIVDEDRVTDIRINTSHIQREWSSPGDGD